MIQGATIRRASTTRTAIEARTIPASHHRDRHRDRSRPDGRDRAHTSPASRARRAISEGSSSPTSAAASAIRSSTESVTASPPAASSSADDVRVGDPAEVVLGADVGARGLAELAAVLGGELERRRDRRHLVLVDRDLERHAVGQLGEPADLGDQERLPEREGADHRAGGLAHGRRAQVDEHVAGGDQRHQPLLRHVALADQRLTADPEPLEPPVEVETLGGDADEQETSARAAPCAGA